MNRKIRMGMVGGGKDAFIGAVHRSAAALDGKIELVCGAFSSSPEKSKASGKELFLPDDRVYGSYEEMIEKEKSLPEGERMDFVSIVTPNYMHFPPAKMALENGFHVVCDKPMTYNLNEAKKLEKLVNETGLLFALTHNYTGYPMVKQARDMVKGGKIGKIRKIVVEYPQGWLAEKLEETGQKQASWRMDPKKAGIASCMGDIGTHAENLSEFITGLKISEMCADLHSFVKGRALEDDGNILLKFDSGASGVLHASQISVGEENNLNIRVYGETGGLEWRQQDPNTLVLKYNDRPMEVYRTGAGFDFLSENALVHTRVPAGHPEGFIEAFANIYRNFALTLGSKLEGKEPDPKFADFPTVHDGVRGMAFLESTVESSKSDKKWTPFKS
ncbi:MAG: Gfo/Idh/MocA family oxidoreductase [Bacteroidales bacterium]|nr:Gfo/Idh/MocA family oxidoreductase [Bacteroidales bacterium]